MTTLELGRVTDRRPPFKYSALARVWFSDTDAQGVVYYGRYLPYFDHARVEYHRHLGLRPRVEGTAAEFVMRASQIEYRAPARKGAVSARPCDTGFAHIAFNVDDAEAAVAAAERYDVKPISPPVAIDQGPNKGRKVVYLRDWDGVTMELIEVKNQ